MSKKAPETKFMRVVRTPGRMFCKAREFYVRSMTKCSNGMVSGPNRPYTSPLPRSFSAVPSRSHHEEDYRELIRAASVRGLGHVNELDMYMKQMMVRQQQSLAAAAGNQTNVINNSSKGLPKSCSAGMAVFMGRIDEDDEAYDEEVSEGGAVKPDQLFSRSKSYAVGKINGSL
ncbi:hypothetical protein Tsubulata_045288 [Turnera subulata]|uniref:Uncharacterized protein n=1 Tax=Turnera subulata TaxID=218843 RepID=A0A9Q0FIG3_9ROSI|nr:hypothetical protein Tsubulata_045288 [Turnera subulata]